MTSASEIANFFAREKVDVVIGQWPSFSAAGWTVSIEKKSRETQIKLSFSHQDFDLALRGAYDKWISVVNGGLPEFRGPLLDFSGEESIGLPPRVEFDNDGIPF